MRPRHDSDHSEYLPYCCPAGVGAGPAPRTCHKLGCRRRRCRRVPAPRRVTEDRASRGGFYEYYLTPRNSLRMGLGWANPKFDRASSDSLRHVRVALDTVHNWEALVA